MKYQIEGAMANLYDLSNPTINVTVKKSLPNVPNNTYILHNTNNSRPTSIEINVKT